MKATGGTEINEYGEVVAIPTNVMFLVALGFLLLALAPCIWLVVRKTKEAKIQKEQKENEAE